MDLFQPSDKRGYTVVELVLVIGILAILIAASVPAFTSFTSRYQADTQSQDLAQLLRIAQNKSMVSEDDSQFGVHLVTGDGGSFTLFKGSTYAGRDLSFDEEVHTLPNGTSLTDTITGDDVIFTKVEGSTVNTGVITITQGAGGSHTVTINEVGMVDLD